MIRNSGIEWTFCEMLIMVFTSLYANIIYSELGAIPTGHPLQRNASERVGRAHRIPRIWRKRSDVSAIGDADTL